MGEEETEEGGGGTSRRKRRSTEGWKTSQETETQSHKKCLHRLRLILLASTSRRRLAVTTPPLKGPLERLSILSFLFSSRLFSSAACTERSLTGGSWIKGSADGEADGGSDTCSVHLPLHPSLLPSLSFLPVKMLTLLPRLLFPADVRENEIDYQLKVC